MKYDDPALQELLAGEYVLGALRGAARARFETLLRRDPALRRRVTQWQERLAPLAQEITEVPPPRRVLRQLRARLRAGATELRWWERLDFWRPFGATAAALLIALTIYFGMPIERVSAPLGPRYVAVLADQAEQPAVVVMAHVNPWRLTVEPLASVTIPPGRVLQIWAVERGTGVVRRLARLTSADAQQTALTQAGWQFVKGAESLIATAEPIEVASTVPTGAVIYSGLCINLKSL
ncbi:MAG: hypothetical protein HY308_05640 [Gammaproteobacteria bacterium]|nr:hypothetical protein [Gammaproteobacteria bacterium]